MRQRSKSACLEEEWPDGQPNGRADGPHFHNGLAR